MYRLWQSNIRRQMHLHFFGDAGRRTSRWPRGRTSITLTWKIRLSVCFLFIPQSHNGMGDRVCRIEINREITAFGGGDDPQKWVATILPSDTAVWHGPRIPFKHNNIKYIFHLRETCAGWPGQKKKQRTSRNLPAEINGERFLSSERTRFRDSVGNWYLGVFSFDDDDGMGF